MIYISNFVIHYQNIQQVSYNQQSLYISPLKQHPILYLLKCKACKCCKFDFVSTYQSTSAKRQVSSSLTGHKTHITSFRIFLFQNFALFKTFLKMISLSATVYKLYKSCWMHIVGFGYSKLIYENYLYVRQCKISCRAFIS